MGFSICGFIIFFFSPLSIGFFALLKKYFPEYEVGYLAGGMTAKEKREIKKQIKDGEIVLNTQLCRYCAAYDVEKQEYVFYSFYE